jgi:ATP-dependent Lhr-like helicase
MTNDQGIKRAFDLLHPAIQQELYRMRWTRLRPIQVSAIQEIIKSDNNIVISAYTAGGKTEAAFLPILSGIVEDFSGSIRALYVGPLKALINDQFRRLEDLCEKTSIPVHRWHGDVGQAPKKKLLAQPSGVLLITPESIESLFVNHPNYIDSLFHRLSYIVIDEMHSFMGTERGAHLKSLICRIVPRSKEEVRLIGLSATLGDVKLSGDWLKIERKRGISLIQDTSEDKTIEFIIQGYVLNGQEEEPQVESETARNRSLKTTDKLIDDIYRSFSGRTALIFGNNKAQLEKYADLIKQKADREKLPNPFLIHHGSLGKILREEAEIELRSDRPTAVFCSSTLEMGIDVGNVSIVGQCGPPWSVNSLIQRLGRSGRKEEESSAMRMYIEESDTNRDDSIVERLCPRLLQATAMTELMLEKWCEPPNTDHIHISTLVHQVMSVIRERGGIRADRLFEILVSSGAFTNISKNLFVDTLKSLGERDIIEQSPEGDLILGMKGEKIANRYDFYAAFRVDEEFSVITNGQKIGTVLYYSSMAVDNFLILGGRRWKIIEVDEERKKISVIPAQGGRLPFFSTRGGTDIHPFVREKMRDLTFSNKVPVYLDATSRELLARARKTAFEAKLDELVFLREGNHTVWFTWTGSKINRTLMLLWNYSGGPNVDDEGIALVFENSQEDEIRRVFRDLIRTYPTPEGLAQSTTVLPMEKYDQFVSKSILTTVFAVNCLDHKGTLNFLKGIV